MAKRKADDLSQAPIAAGSKKAKHVKAEETAQPFSLMDDSDSENSQDDSGGVKLKINEEYAKRFEHNKKREELSRCGLSCFYFSLRKTNVV